jgi:hypothetical protein
MAQQYGPDNLAIFAYDSLLSDPGEKILPTLWTASLARVRVRSNMPAGQSCAVMDRPGDSSEWRNRPGAAPGVGSSAKHA